MKVEIERISRTSWYWDLSNNGQIMATCPHTYSRKSSAKRGFARAVNAIVRQWPCGLDCAIVAPGPFYVPIVIPKRK